MSIEDKLREMLQTPHEDSFGTTVMTFPTTRLLEQIIQAFKDDGWHKRTKDGCVEFTIDKESHIEDGK